MEEGKSGEAEGKAAPQMRPIEEVGGEEEEMSADSGGGAFKLERKELEARVPCGGR